MQRKESFLLSAEVFPEGCKNILCSFVIRGVVRYQLNSCLDHLPCVNHLELSEFILNAQWKCVFTHTLKIHLLKMFNSIS